MAVINTISTFYKTSEANPKDNNQPYSFQDWKLRNPNVFAGDVINLYNSYVKNWYKNKETVNTAAVDFIQNSYKVFLQSLGFSARTAQEKAFFENVNIEDNLSLQSVIAGYAKKLKDVSVYIASKRNLIAYAKLRNNLTGTSVSLERLFYFYILNSFTRKNTPDGTVLINFIDPNIISSLPVLEQITNNFKIEIEELYDTSNYFDRDPSVDITTYTTIASGVPAALYESGSYQLTEELKQQLIDEALVNSIVEILTGTGTTGTTGATASDYFTFIGDGYTTTYQLSGLTTSTASKYQVSIDGVVQTPNTVYTISTINQSITFCEAPPATTIIVIVKRY
jgi:hypothetical protein